MKGRKPKPPRLQIVGGNAGKRAIREDEVRIPSEYAPAPEYMDAYAREAWEKLVPVLVKNGLFTVLDHHALEQYCQTYGRWRRAEEILAEEGSDTYETHGKQGTMKRALPEVAIIAESIRLMRSVGSEFGLSPVARLRLGDVGQGDMFNVFRNLENQG
ncbi:MAG: phage terminase small subunit P27 family [Acetobacter sp.]|nr:phage terminase small subunit P27 family [Acetobacter sp.]MCH4060481.1 phage terminase small subunit P27 family [Acetobacter sp.]MCH4087421.1 phage terminase small subunit P27 family [Acetobacter sp.]MCI1293939.1 phage terminase small subunit P27 family [Acetobacter sp.]MCI1320467.1 phage terminase small subunit P27 family [Acetobacter sp.]